VSSTLWMIVCLVFVFASLIEYAVVNVIARRPALRGPTAAAGDDVGQAPASVPSSNVEVDRSVAARSRWKRVVRSTTETTDDTPLRQAISSSLLSLQVHTRSSKQNAANFQLIQLRKSLQLVALQMEIYRSRPRHSSLYNGD